MSGLDRIGLSKLTTLSLFEWRAAQSPAQVAVSYFERGEWRTLTWGGYASLVKALVGRLKRAGLSRGDRVAVYADTCFQWALMDLAVQSFGGVVVAVHPSYSAEEVLHALRVSQAKFIFFGGERPAQTIGEILAACGQELTVYSFDDGPSPHPSVKSFRDFLSEAGQSGDAPAGDKSGGPAEVGEDDPATIVFTSGTSGLPKAVCLTQRNLVATAAASYRHLGHHLHRPRSLHWLPFAHLFGRIGAYLDLVAGCMATYSRGVQYLPEDLKLARPHFIFAVPKALTRFQAAVMKQVQERAAWKRALFNGGLKLAGRIKLDGGSLARPASRALRGAIKRLIFPSVIESFGGNLRLIIVGSAPVETKLFGFFEAFGISVLEGYGMTETSGVAFINPYHGSRAGTVGTAIDTIQFRIGEDQELLLKGESVCRGYLRPEDNEAAFTEDGWFRTGDLADVDQAGYVRVVGRKKDIIITDGGENITPERIEAKLTSHPLIKDAVVLGDRKPYLVAVINADPGHLASAKNGRGDGHNYLLAEAVQSVVDEANRGLARFETIRKFLLTNEDFSVEKGELTPTLKKRRKVIEQRYRPEIEALYR